MTEKEYKEKLEAFKDSCRVYRQEKQMMEELQLKSGSFGNERLHSYIKADIEYVDRMLEEISKKCGSNARLMIWLLFVEEKTQVDVAVQYGLSRRQLQYSISKWMHKVFDDAE